MIELIHWFSTNYPEHKRALQNSHHNFDDRETNPYHLEGDCWSHTMMVCKIAQLKEYDPVVQVASLLHDIGKPASRKVNPKNNHVQFFGHEALSAEIAEPLVADLVEKEMLTQNEAEETLELIAFHSYLYKQTEEEIYQKFKGRAVFFKHLIELGICDDLGRFAMPMGKSAIDVKCILEKIENSSTL